MENKLQLINSTNDVSVREQCKVLKVSRSSVYYKRAPDFTDEEIKILHKIDEVFTQTPFYGHRRLWKELQGLGYQIGRDKVIKFMKVLGLEAFYPKKKTTIKNKNHKVYPYLLKGLNINKPNKVWSCDITYIRMNRGFCYLVAIIDWFSRCILAHRISNSLDTDSCIDCLNEALIKYPKPEIFNTDQGCQFTSTAFTGILTTNLIQISMDSKGRAIDNVIIERFWRSIKYENIYLNEYNTIPEVIQGVNGYVDFYNQKRPHQSLNYKTPKEIYLNINVNLKNQNLRKEEFLVTI